MTVIGKAKAIELLERAVHEKGADYVYERSVRDLCTYQRDGQPSCIVGHAYVYAGATIEQLRDMDNGTDDEVSIDYLYDTDALPIDTTEGAVIVFSEAQEAQDEGVPWGEALRKARAAAKSSKLV